MLANRLDQMEKEYQALVHTVTTLEHSITVVKIEQSHLKDLVSARLSVIEKSQELQMAKMDQIGNNIIAMGGDPDKTPAGRTILNLLATQAHTVDDHSSRLADHNEVHRAIQQWQDRVDGVLYTLKWLGAGGLAALVLAILNVLRMSR
jgi:hypothetical protein